jgi:uncharacterized membrane protein HdeD (DUF308 family)
MSTPIVQTPEPLHRDEPRLAGMVAGTVGGSIALRGALAMLFGIIVLLSPGAAATALVALFVIWAFIDAVIAFLTAYRRGKAHESWGWFIFEGLVGIAAGVLALVWPKITLLVLLILVAARALVLGVAEIAGAIGWKGAHARWLHGLTGVVSILFAIALIARPLAGMMALIWLLGIYALVFGVMNLALGLDLRSQPLRGTITPSGPERAGAA